METPVINKSKNTIQTNDEDDDYFMDPEFLQANEELEVANLGTSEVIPEQISQSANYDTED